MKNGFVFIETVITVVILSASLLLLYNAYSTAIYDEKERLYYDDVAYIYRTNEVRKFLEDYSNINEVKNYSFNNSYIVNIGPKNDTLFTPEQDEKNYRKSFETIFSSYHINQILLVQSEYVYNCFNEGETKCSASYDAISYEMQNYLKSLNEINYNYYLVIEYAERVNDENEMEKCIPGTDDNCKTYFVNLGV